LFIADKSKNVALLIEICERQVSDSELLQTKLWKLYIGWATSLSPATTPVCDWRPCSPPLAACTTTRRLQSCGHGVSSTERSVYAIPGSASSCCWSAWSSLSALILITPAAGSDISSSYRRPAFISSICVHPLEQLVCCYSVIILLDRLLPEFHRSPDLLL